ncbi:MAG TPA: DUF547 domain-containing protein [bacterium]|nr:DUF547 domain-containing protein [bacterium]
MRRLIMKPGKIVIIMLPFLFLGFSISGFPQVSQQNNFINIFSEEYASILKSYVDDSGMVNYRELKKNNDRLEFAYNALAKIQEAEYNQWTESEKIAFLINTYNFLTLKVIIDNYPVKPSFFSSLRFPKNSIRQISGVWDEIQFTIMGQKMTLDHIEHEILRRQFDEPRIHMVLVCAAMGCPPLRKEPYSASKLDKQFEDQIRRFINDSSKFRIDKQKNHIYLSSIFKWFGDDFIQRYGTNDVLSNHNEQERAVLYYFAQYLSPLEYDFLLSESYDISYLDYDWTLNEQ